MKVRLFSTLALGATLLAHTAALKALPGPLGGKRVLVHLKTGFKQDDNQPCVAFDMALAALKQGAKVEMFFDAAAVVDLKIWQGKPTSLAYEVPDKLKDILVAEYKTPAKKDFPKTYQELLRWLHMQGVEVTFNGTMAKLTSLSSAIHDVGQLEPIAKPLSLAEVLQHRARADIYFVY
jgi:predicted peroxiredoxin